MYINIFAFKFDKSYITYCCLCKIESSCELLASRYSITTLHSTYQTCRSYINPQYMRPEDSNDAHGTFTEE